MCPIIVPESVKAFMKGYREVFCKDAGFNHICDYITGLIISSNKTLQGIYNLSVLGRAQSSRRAMHKSVFESQGWNIDTLMKKHREIVSKDHCKRGKKRSNQFGLDILSS